MNCADEFRNDATAGQRVSDSTVNGAQVQVGSRDGRRSLVAQRQHASPLSFLISMEGAMEPKKELRQRESE